MNQNPPRTYSLASCYENSLTTILRLASMAQQSVPNSQGFRTSIRAALKTAMEQAKSLLKESNLSVGKISISLGYKNRDHFCRLFHSMVEQSPRKYKSTHRLAEKQKSQCA